MLDFGRVKFKIKSFVFIAMIFAVVFTCKTIFAEQIIAGTNFAAFYNYYTPNVYSIDVTIAPKKTTYSINEYLDMSGLVIRVLYDNNTSDNVMYNSANALDFKFEPSLSIPLNTNHAFVTITYKDHSASIPISVRREVTPVSSSGGVTSSASGARMGRVIEKENQNAFASMNADAMNLFLLSLFAASMNANQLAAVQTVTSPIPTAISNYINSNPNLLYTVNSDGSYAFSNGTVVYPNGMMVDLLGNTYYTDGTILTSNGLTQFVNGSVKDTSGAIYNLDGTIKLPDNSYIDKSGVTHYSDGSIKLTDGTIYNIDGSIDFPNGTVITKSGRVIKRTKKAVETEEKEKNRAAWRYDPAGNEWHVELGDKASTYYK